MEWRQKFRINRHLAVFAFSLLLLGIFVYLLHETLENEFHSFDEQVTAAVKAQRTFRLTRVFLEVTALGSFPVLFLLCVGTLLLLGLAGRWLHFLQLLFVSLGGFALMELIKRLVGRERPSVADQLDVVSGYSFPSGHSSSSSGIYFTLAFFLLPLLRGDLRRGLFLGWVGFFVSLIAASRVYLGVHYFTDAGAGFCLGTGLACLAHLLFHRPWQKDRP